MNKVQGVFILKPMCQLADVPNQTLFATRDRYERIFICCRIGDGWVNVEGEDEVILLQGLQTNVNPIELAFT